MNSSPGAKAVIWQFFSDSSEFYHQHQQVIPAWHWTVQNRMIGFVKQVIDFKFRSKGYFVPLEILPHDQVIHKVGIQPVSPGQVIA
jgi:hypothetical protein